MILSSLARLYDRLSSDPNTKIPARYWSRETVTFRLFIDASGAVLGADAPVVSSGGKNRSLTELVPEHVGRSGTGLMPFFLCENAAYLLGLDEKGGTAKFAATAELHRTVLGGCSSEAARAVLGYFERGTQLDALSQETREAMGKGGFIALWFAPKPCYAWEDQDIQAAWEAYCSARSDKNEGGVEGVCSVTGERAPIARLFPQVTGFAGAQSSGASLVSFNMGAFESYGKKQAYNASISEDAAFKAGTALRFLVKDEYHRVRLGDTTVVFWADRAVAREDSMLQRFLAVHDIKAEASEGAEDSVTREELYATLRAIGRGRSTASFDLENRYYLLGLSPNAARLSVRFFYTETFGTLARHFAEYLDDMAMVGLKRFSLAGLLRQTGVLGEADNIPSTLVHAAYDAMLTGSLFPQSLMGAVLTRMRCDRGAKHSWDTCERAALLKACLVRKRRKSGQEPVNERERIMEGLNESNTNTGYVLGRLFAYIERAQELASGGTLNATVRDKYIGTAATAPSRVFPLLLGNCCQNHLGKIRKSNPGAAVNLEKQIEEVMMLLDTLQDVVIPKTLDADDQAAFYIGFYQQKYVIWNRRRQKADDAAPAEDVA